MHCLSKVSSASVFFFYKNMQIVTHIQNGRDV